MKVAGYVERIGITQVRGWAYCPEQRGLHLEVAVISGDRSIATGKADLYRQDLQQSGVGDGDHAFVINFEQAIEQADLSTISVFILNDVLAPTKLAVLDSPSTNNPGVEPSLGEAAFNDLQLRRLQQSPVLVLGAARSGTSAMAQCLLRCGLFDGFEEGHFLGMLPRLLSATEKYYADNHEEIGFGRRTLISRIPRVVLDESLKDLFRLLARMTFPNGRWLDKTPTVEMVRAAPLMLQVWPNARFIFMKRRALENVASRMKKFPQVSFEDHCQDWTRVMSSWREIRSSLGSAAIEIEQTEMAKDPDIISRRVATFLDMPAQAVSLFTQALRVEQPERTSANLNMPLSLDLVGWSNDQKMMFKTLCKEEMSAYAYHLDFGEPS